MTPEEARKKLEERAKAQEAANKTTSPNPAKVEMKWKFVEEQVKLENGRMASLPSGQFEFAEKGEDGQWKRLAIPEKGFKIAVIDHQIIKHQGSEWDGKRITRSYWTNEMRQQDSMTTPFLLAIKTPDYDGSKIAYDTGTTKELREKHDIKGRLHVIYGLTQKGSIIKLVLPYYSYSLGSEKFKTHGDTLLDANRKSIAEGNGGITACWLTYSGFHELKTGTNVYTAPKFQFTEPLGDDMYVPLFEATEVVEQWYNEYHANNIERIDKFLNGESISRPKPSAAEPEAQAETVAAEDDGWEDDDQTIPF